MSDINQVDDMLLELFDKLLAKDEQTLTPYESELLCILSDWYEKATDYWMACDEVLSALGWQ